MTTESNWRAQSACKDEPKGKFYPDLKTGTYSDYEFISEMCDTCPVRNQCRDYAMVRNRELGFWAGTTHATRQILMSNNDIDIKWSLSSILASADHVKEYRIAESEMWVL